MPVAGITLVVLSTLCTPAAHPLIAEVFYDAVGDDTGLEFVELYNPADHAFALTGVRLEAGDGSGPGRWTLRWTGGTTDSIRPFARFVIGGAQVTPPPAATVTLELQNGPDAVRLVWPDGASEVVGYGVHEFAEYACGSPAPDVASGQSLARVPDDSDQGSNAADFRAAPPSPGRANQASRNAAVMAGSLALDPIQPPVAAIARLSGWVANRGREAWDQAGATLSVSAAGQIAMPRAIGPALAPFDSVHFDEPLGPLAAGVQTITARVVLAGDESPEDDADSLEVRVGPGPLEVMEIQFHPAAGEGEWIEARNREAVALDPRRFTLSDRGAARGTPSGGAGALPPDSLVVLAQSRILLLGRYTGLDSTRVWQVSPWSALNNSDDSSGVADVVTLRDSLGILCDRVAYSAAGVPTGVPLEKRDGAWWPALDPGGTPLASPRAPAPLTGRFELARRRVPPGGALRVEWALPWARGRITIEVYDLAGQRVRRLLADDLVPGRGAHDWPVADLPAGVYVVGMRARPESGPGDLAETRVLRVDGVTP